MILHLGGDESVPLEHVVAIMDPMTLGAKVAASLIQNAKAKGQLMPVCTDEARSLVLCQHQGKHTLYLCPISSMTLLKRSHFLQDIDK